MRFAIATVLGLFLTVNLVGCGGSGIPAPPADAKTGPPPGMTDAWSKPPVAPKKK